MKNDVQALADALRVAPGKPAALAKRDPGDLLGLLDKPTAQARRADLVEEMAGLHDRLWAEAQRSVLLVLQGMDTAGKDGAIKRVFSGLNPQGFHIASFKAPSDAELAHDYLRRIHHECPRRGEIGIFNRSHYEDVVAARIIGVVDAKACARRHGHIRDFERMLTDEGTTLVKVFLNISHDEQRKRLQARLDDPTKRWKFKPDDLDTRAKWPAYQKVYEEVITATSTKDSPWYVVPADHKWVRDVAVASLIVSTMRALDPRYPKPEAGLDDVVVT
ncbi:MAG: PPK2 family polyphosphate kinase [Acidimicrobiia bacterium]